MYKWFDKVSSVMSPGASCPACTFAAIRCTASAIQSYLQTNNAVLDIDADGERDPLTDGLLVERWLFGVRGSSLVNGATDVDCTRCSAAAIESYLSCFD